MIVPFNLLSLFGPLGFKNKAGAIRYAHEEAKDSELYCQNPQCRHPKISKGEDVANIEANLIHSDRECVLLYISHKALNSGKMVVCSNIPYISYNEAQELAKENKVKFSKLEKGVKLK
jgi:hypothetical protein